MNWHETTPRTSTRHRFRTLRVRRLHSQTDMFTRQIRKNSKRLREKNRIRLVTPQVLHQLTQHANGEPQGASRVLSLHTVHVYTRKVLFIYFPFSPTLRRPLTSASRHTPVQSPLPTTTTTQAWRTVSFGAYDWGHGALSATLAHSGLSGAPPLLSIYLVILSPKTWTSAKKTTEKSFAQYRHLCKFVNYPWIKNEPKCFSRSSRRD